MKLSITTFFMSMALMMTGLANAQSWDDTRQPRGCTDSIVSKHMPVNTIIRCLR